MEGTKRATTVRLPEYMLADLNAEARSGVEMEELTHEQIEHFEEYVASL